MAAIPRDLIESELFGVEKGAYTGALRSKPGLVEEAAGGTLFLDEIGELDSSLQPKLLRFLETKQARRVGSTKEYHGEVRVIAATNRDLELAIEQGRFRADLYYRLAEIILRISPLKHRLEDIPDLVQVFVKDSEERLGKHFDIIEPELISKFQQHSWPGNVRELKQTIDRLAILYDGPVMRAAWWDIPVNRAMMQNQNSGFPDQSKAGLQAATASAATNSSLPHGNAAVDLMHSVPNRKEKLDLARRLLLESDNDLTWVAGQLGIHPTTLYRWRKSGKV